MEHTYPDYQFPRDIAVAIKDGRDNASCELSSIKTRPSRIKPHHQLGSIFTSGCSKQTGLLTSHFTGTIEFPIDPVEKYGFSAARSILAIGIARDAFLWILAEELRKYDESTLQDINSERARIFGRMGATEEPVPIHTLLAQYPQKYLGDNRISSIFSMPGILLPDEDPNICINTYIDNISLTP